MPYIIRATVSNRFESFTSDDNKTSQFACERNPMGVGGCNRARGDGTDISDEYVRGEATLGAITCLGTSYEPGSETQAKIKIFELYLRTRRKLNYTLVIVVMIFL